MTKESVKRYTIGSLSMTRSMWKSYQIVAMLSLKPRGMKDEDFHWLFSLETAYSQPYKTLMLRVRDGETCEQAMERVNNAINAVLMKKKPEEFESKIPSSPPASVSEVCVPVESQIPSSPPAPVSEVCVPVESAQTAE